LTRKIERLRIAQLGEFGEAERLKFAILGMHQRHVEEFPLLWRHRSVPAALDREYAELLRQRVASERLGFPAEDVARELIDQDDRGEQRVGRAAPCGGVGAQHLFTECAEARCDRAIEAGRFGEALLVRNFVEPERENGARVRVDFAVSGPQGPILPAGNGRDCHRAPAGEERSADA